MYSRDHLYTIHSCSKKFFHPLNRKNTKKIKKGKDNEKKKKRKKDHSFQG